MEDLIATARVIVGEMMQEHQAISSGIGELEDLIIEATASDKDVRRRNAMLKAISYPVRTQALKNLATALRSLADAGHGKKKEREEAARTVGGAHSKWGNDLDVSSPPRRN